MERPNSSLSAHERLFGASASRETSMSPPASPLKKSSAGGGSGPSSSEHSAMASPIFKSAAAKAIIEEVGKNPRPSAFAIKRAERRDKKRSFTITGSQPAVMEALNEHQAKMVSMVGFSHVDSNQLSVNNISLIPVIIKYKNVRF